MKPSTEPSSGNGSPSAAGEDALTLARDLLPDYLLNTAIDRVHLREKVAAALDAAYARGRAAGPVMDEAHPWLAFLDARADAIDWLRTEGKSDAEIAVTLSMDPTQVYLIRTRDRAALAERGEG